MRRPLVSLPLPRVLAGLIGPRPHHFLDKVYVCRGGGVVVLGTSKSHPSGISRKGRTGSLSPVVSRTGRTHSSLGDVPSLRERVYTGVYGDVVESPRSPSGPRVFPESTVRSKVVTSRPPRGPLRLGFFPRRRSVHLLLSGFD